MKHMLTLLLSICAFTLFAQNAKIIKTVDDYERPIPFVQVLLPGMDMLLSDTAGCILLPDKLHKAALVAFVHMAFQTRYVKVSDLERFVTLLKKDREPIYLNGNGSVDLHLPPVAKYELPLDPTFKIDYTFKSNFIVVFNTNVMKDQYYPQYDRSKYAMEAFSLSHQHFQQIKADSFNPHGASTPAQAIAGGASDFLFFMIAK